MPYKHREDLTVQSIDEETLILDMGSDHIHQLNPTASFIWGMIDGASSVDHLIDMFAARFDVELETARSDVGKVLNQLCDMGLIEGF
jgi:hydrogenase/urease accessory protein HupE